MTQVRTRRALAATCLVALAGFTSPATAEPTPATSQAVPLAATTVIETAGSGTAEVFIPRTARLSGLVEQNPDVLLSGAGRLVGVWLEPLGESSGYLASYRLPAFAGGEQLTYGSRPYGECRPRAGALPLTAECETPAADEPLELSSGAYRLTVLADGAPLQVTLRLQGLDEVSRSVPLQPLESVQRALPVRETLGDRLVTFGDSADVGGPARTFTVVAAAPVSTETGPILLREASTCERDGASAPPFGYGPHCPGGTSGSYGYAARVGDQDTFGGGAFASSSTEERSGPIGLGGSVGDSRGVVFGEALGVWLALP